MCVRAYTIHTIISMMLHCALNTLYKALDIWQNDFTHLKGNNSNSRVLFKAFYLDTVESSMATNQPTTPLPSISLARSLSLSVFFSISIE